MKKLLILSLSIFIGLCFSACGNEGVSEPTEETSVTTVEETKAEAEPITKEDFIVKVDNESEEEDVLAEFEGENDAYFFCYNPSFDDSKEGVVKTHRGIVLGDAKEKVNEKYGDGKSGDFDVDNDYCYEMTKNVTMEDDSETSDVSALMSAQCITYERYSFGSEYTISFYFDEDNEVSWIFFTRIE